MTAPLTVDIYTRLSQYDKEQTATARQARDAKAFAKLKGLKVGKVHEDLDLSAYRKGVRRPAYEELLQRITSRATHGVIVWKLDRLVRRSAEFERFWSACEDADAVLMSVHEPVDTSTEIGMVVVRILIAFAQLESATMSIRIRSALEGQARSGRPHKSTQRPFGLTADWSAVNPVEAAAANEAADRILAGETLRSIAMDWNRRGLKTTTGGIWQPPVIARTLKHPRMVGDRAFHGDIAASDCFPAVIDREKHARLVAVLAANPAPIGPPRRHLLSGLLHCGKCGKAPGTPMNSSLTIDRARRYHCPAPPRGCNGTSVLAEPIEEFIAERLAGVLNAQRLAPKPASDQFSLLAAKLTDLDARLAELGRDYYSRRTISRTIFDGAHRELQHERDQVARQLAQHRHDHVLTELRSHIDIEGTWQAATVDQRRAWLAAMIDHITVRPLSIRGAHRFEPGRFEIAWRAV